tara:strand:+ start:5214 stop:5750 length:537 start_codon:yes stop_codon:yes gene_type:complete
MTKIWEYKSSKDDKLSKKVEKDKDIVMTKPSMAKHLLERIDFKKGDILLEPALGKGAFYDNFPSYTRNEWCEINKGKDFLTYEGKVDYVISNPPFVPRKLFWDFHTHAMDITQKGIYWLINLASLNVFTPKRLDEMKALGWYIQNIHIVQDKRWFGRYAFICINKTPNVFITHYKKSF